MCTADRSVSELEMKTDLVAEFGRLADFTELACVLRFCSGITEFVEKKLLRPPTQQKTKVFGNFANCAGFFGMLGLVDN